uniref:Uncharacterized protein n=1 Tax=Strigamia maritima TaxID=126957 RepID=T1IJW6_STRMM
MASTGGRRNGCDSDLVICGSRTMTPSALKSFIDLAGTHNRRHISFRRFDYCGFRQQYLKIFPPGCDLERKNLTEFNTAHSRKISMLGIPDEGITNHRKKIQGHRSISQSCYCNWRFIDMGIKRCIVLNRGTSKTKCKGLTFHFLPKLKIDGWLGK